MYTTKKNYLKLTMLIDNSTLNLHYTLATIQIWVKLVFLRLSSGCLLLAKLLKSPDGSLNFGAIIASPSRHSW